MQPISSGNRPKTRFGPQTVHVILCVIILTDCRSSVSEGSNFYFVCLLCTEVLGHFFHRCTRAWHRICHKLSQNCTLLLVFVSFLLSARLFVWNSSSVDNLKSGIPQGTVLGPVLFLIFICDLPSVVENEPSILGDDTTIFTFGEILAYSCRSLTLDLNTASHWAKVWGMLYNAEKSHHLTVRSKHVLVLYPPISMRGVALPQVDHHKHLSIHFNKSLTWTDHVNEVFSSCAWRIGMLRRLQRILPNAAIRSIYVGSIRPILEHACRLWCGGPIAKLVKLQESFGRRHLVTLPPVEKQFDFHTLILFYKIKSIL